MRFKEIAVTAMITALAALYIHQITKIAVPDCASAFAMAGMINQTDGAEGSPRLESLLQKCRAEFVSETDK